MPFYVVKTLQQDADMLLGQDCLQLHDSEIRNPWKQDLVKVPPISETIVEFAIAEKGIRYCRNKR
jgi:DNA replication protein DnaD